MERSPLPEICREPPRCGRASGRDRPQSPRARVPRPPRLCTAAWTFGAARARRWTPGRGWYLNAPVHQLKLKIHFWGDQSWGGRVCLDRIITLQWSPLSSLRLCSRGPGQGERSGTLVRINCSPTPHPAPGKLIQVGALGGVRGGAESQRSSRIRIRAWTCVFPAEGLCFDTDPHPPPPPPSLPSILHSV